MKFILNARYTTDVALVDRVRPAHKIYVAKLAEENKLVLSGPYADGSGALMVYEAESLEAAHSLASSDPFNLEGVFASHEVKEWKLAYVSSTL